MLGSVLGLFFKVLFLLFAFIALIALVSLPIFIVSILTRKIQETFDDDIPENKKDV